MGHERQIALTSKLKTTG